MQMGPIVGVRPDSPAARAGLKPGDIIEKVDGVDVGDPITLPQRLREEDRKQITLQVLRKKENADDPQQLSFKLIPVPVPWGSEMRGKMEIPSLGIAYKISDTIAGVQADSPAAKANFFPGDKIVAIDLKPANEAQAEKERTLFPDNRLRTQEIGAPGASVGFSGWVRWRRVSKKIRESKSPCFEAANRKRLKCHPQRFRAPPSCHAGSSSSVKQTSCGQTICERPWRLVGAKPNTRCWPYIAFYISSFRGKCLRDCLAGREPSPRLRECRPNRASEVYCCFLRCSVQILP